MVDVTMTKAHLEYDTQKLMKYSTTIDLSKVENEYNNGDWWLMQLRMVQPLNVKTK